MKERPQTEKERERRGRKVASSVLESQGRSVEAESSLGGWKTLGPLGDEGKASFYHRERRTRSLFVC